MNATQQPPQKQQNRNEPKPQPEMLSVKFKDGTRFLLKPDEQGNYDKSLIANLSETHDGPAQS